VTPTLSGVSIIGIIHRAEPVRPADVPDLVEHLRHREADQDLEREGGDDQHGGVPHRVEEQAVLQQIDVVLQPDEQHPGAASSTGPCAR